MGQVSRAFKIITSALFWPSLSAACSSAFSIVIAFSGYNRVRRTHFLHSFSLFQIVHKLRGDRTRRKYCSLYTCFHPGYRLIQCYTIIIFDSMLYFSVKMPIHSLKNLAWNLLFPSFCTFISSFPYLVVLHHFRVICIFHLVWHISFIFESILSPLKVYKLKQEYLAAATSSST